MNKLLIAPLCILAFFTAPAQQPTVLKDTMFTDMTLPDREPTYNYGFSYPVYSNVVFGQNNNGTPIDPAAFAPGAGTRYFMSLFGPRYKSTPGSNVYQYDFHQGEDISAYASYQGNNFDDAANKPFEICMCDGKVTGLLDGTDAQMEATEQGRSVTITCDSSFRANPAWGKIMINYRHLTYIDPALKARGTNSIIHKGDTIGLMGNTGATHTVHLHMSVGRSSPSGMILVHPMRIFDPESITHIHGKIDTSIVVQLLRSYTDSAIFRIAIPYNKLSVKRITVKHRDNYNREFDFETISTYPNRDDNNVVSGLELFAYPLNRYLSAYNRYSAATTDSSMYIAYPASPLRPAERRFPITNTAPFNKPVYVLDIIVRQLPAGYDSSKVTIDIADIYGTTVRSAISFTTPEPTGIQETTGRQEDFSIYPNPATGTLNIRFNAPVTPPIELTITNSLGKCVSKLTHTGHTQTIDISGLANGVYFLSAGAYRQTFVKH